MLLDSIFHIISHHHMLRSYKYWHQLLSTDALPANWRYIGTAGTGPATGIQDYIHQLPVR